MAGSWILAVSRTQNSTITGKRLFRGEFESRDERDQIFQQMVLMGLNESVRVWLVTALQCFPIRAECRT